MNGLPVGHGAGMGTIKQCDVVDSGFLNTRIKSPKKPVVVLAKSHALVKTANLRKNVSAVNGAANIYERIRLRDVAVAGNALIRIQICNLLNTALDDIHIRT